jgi:hypothetical protein
MHRHVVRQVSSCVEMFRNCIATIEALVLNSAEQRFPNCGEPQRGGGGGGWYSGWGRGVCLWDKFILKEIGGQGKIFFDSHFAWLKYFTYHLLLVPVLAPNCKQHILLPAKVR